MYALDGHNSNIETLLTPQAKVQGNYKLNLWKSKTNLNSGRLSSTISIAFKIDMSSGYSSRIFLVWKEASEAFVAVNCAYKNFSKDNKPTVS
jgi:hypothetical protein